MAEYRQKLCNIEEIPAHDELVAGDIRQCEIGAVKIAGPVCLKRGTLLVSSGDMFIAAGASASSADELCILAEDIDLLEDEEGWFTGYFGGMFKGSAVILPYETAEDDHFALLEELTGKLRKQKMRIE